MGAWHNTYADLLRMRFSALVAYANLLVPDPVAARELAQDAALAVFSKRRTPRGTQAAELAARAWMATHAPDATQAAVVLQAIDAKDPMGVKAVLRKATPDPLPQVTEEQILAMRMRFVEHSREYAVPSGGVNAMIAPARRQRQSALGRAALAVVGAVAAVAAAGFAAVNYLPSDGDPIASGPSASASPSPSLSPVTWDPEPDFKAAMANFSLPKCGDEFAPAPKAVDGLTPKPSGDVERDAQYGDWVMLSAGFVSDDAEKRAVLAAGAMFVVTLDDIVVYADDGQFYGMSLFVANMPATVGGSGINRGSLCDAQEAAKEVTGDFKDLDWNSMTDEERAKYDKAWTEFAQEWKDFPPGTYKIYQVTPMVFGEQLALGMVFDSEGVRNLDALTSDISWSSLASDPRVAPFCTGSQAVGDWSCQVPPDVLKEVLTREIDPTTIDDTAPGVGISEPLVYELGGEED